MSTRDWANFAIGAGTGYLGAETNRRERKRQDTRDEQDKQLFDARLRNENARFDDAELERRDRNTLRTAARPIVPEEDGAGGMVRPAEMDNRDVGLPENQSQPNQGLASARYKVAGKEYGSRSEADAAAAPLNTPEAAVKRYTAAQTSLGDFRGASQTRSDFEKTKREQRSLAADEMMRDISGGLVKGWGEFTDVLSKSSGDGNDYRQETDPKTGKINLLQVNRQTGAGRVIGSYDDNDAGKLEAYKMVGSVIAGKPEIAMQHIADKRKMAREDANSAREERKVGALEKRADAAETVALRGGRGGDGTSKEERLRYTNLFNEAGRRIGETQKAIGTLQRDPVFMVNARKPDSPEAQQLAELKGNLKQHNDERSLYQGLLAGSQSAPGPANPTGPASAGEAGMKDSVSGDMGADPVAIQREIAATQQSLANVKDAGSRQQLTAYVADLQGQLSRAAPGLADAQRPATASATPVAAIKKISSAAERDALPKGTKYVAPNGQTYVKQ